MRFDFCVVYIMAARVVQSRDSNDHAGVNGTKSDRAQKSELIREIHKLEVQVQAMEREKSTHIYSKRSEFRADFIQLEEQDTNSTAERKTEKIKVRQQLEKISHMVKRFQRELKDVKPTPEFVEKLKFIMEDIEGTINAFKEQQRYRYEELMKEERGTLLEIQNLEKKFESWTQTPRVQSARPVSTRPVTSARDVTKDLPPEVAAFERFQQQTGGVRGGWDEYDHQTFLKVRQKFKGRITFLDQLPSAIPTKTETEIREHESWYQEYLFLLDNKKYAIKKWREKREDEKEDILSKADEDDEMSVELEKLKQKRQQELLEQEKSQRYAQVNAWKVQKELEKAEEEERKLREEMTRQKKREEERKRQQEVKQKVLALKKQREEEEEIIKHHKLLLEQEQLEMKQRIAAREIEKFRSRDQQRLEEKLLKERLKEEEKVEKEMLKERIKQNVENKVQRDPNRLLKPTAGWKQRLKDNTPSNSGPVIHMPHRAIPSWRKGP